MKDGKARYKFGKNLKPFGNWVFDGTTAKALRVWDNAQSKTLFNGLNKGNSFLYTDPGTGVSTFQNYIGAGAVRHLPARTAKEMSRPYGLARPPNAPSAAAPSNPGGIIAPPTEPSGPPLRPKCRKHCPLCGKDVDFSKQKPNAPAASTLLSHHPWLWKQKRSLFPLRRRVLKLPGYTNGVIGRPASESRASNLRLLLTVTAAVVFTPRLGASHAKEHGGVTYSGMKLRERLRAAYADPLGNRSRYDEYAHRPLAGHPRRNDSTG